MKSITLLIQFITFALVSSPLWSNDSCIDAIEIEVNSYPSYQDTYSGVFSNSIENHTDLICTDRQWNDVWYFFDAPSSNLLIKANYAELYKGQDCDNLTFLRCIKTGEISNEYLENERYYLRLIGYQNDSYTVSVNIPPPSINDTSCENAHTLVIDSAYQHSFSGCLNDDPFEGQNNCTYNSYTDIWYTFTAETLFYKFFVYYFSIGGEVQVYKGNCDQLELIYCKEKDDAHTFSTTGSFYMPFEIGKKYYIRITAPIDNPLNTETFSVLLKETTAKFNNFCNGSITLDIHSNISTCKSFSQFNTSTDTTIVLPPCWNSNQIYDSWYRFNPLNNKYLLSTNSGNLAVYKGTCDSLNLIDCGKDLILDSLDNEDTYYIRTVGSGEFCLNPVAINGSCNNAINVEPRDREVFNTYSFEEAGLSIETCDTTETSDIWFTFTAETASTVFLPRGNNGKLTLSIFEGSCDNLALIDCYERADKFYHIVENLTVGQKYFFRYSGKSTDPATFCLVNLPDNKFVSSAIKINGDTCIAGNTKYIISDTSSYNGESYNFPDGLWYEFTPKKEVYLFDLIQESSPDIYIYKRSPSGQIKALTFLSDSFSDMGHFKKNIHFISGSTYLINIPGDRGPFELCLTGLDLLGNNYLRQNAIELSIDSTMECDFTYYASRVNILWENDTMSCVPEPKDASQWYYFRPKQSKVLLKSTSIDFQLFEVDSVNVPHLQCPIIEGKVPSSMYESQGYVISELNVEKTYLLRLHQDAALRIKTMNELYPICLLTPPTNSNDHLSDALEIEIKHPYSCRDTPPENTFYSANNSPTDSTLFSSICDSDLLNYNDVWFTFQATDTILGLYFYDIRIMYYELYYWDGVKLLCHQFERHNSFESNTANPRLNNLVKGERYYLRFTQFDNPENLIEVDFCLHEITPPPNNSEKDNAIPLVSANNLTECYASEDYSFNNSDNSVWYKFEATDNNHQLVIKGFDIPYDITFYEFDIDGNAIDSVNYEYFNIVLPPPYVVSNRATWIGIDPAIHGFYNFTDLDIGVEYHIKLSLHDYFRNILQFNEDLMSFDFKLCLKTLPPPPSNNSLLNSRKLEVTNDQGIDINGYATLSVVDYINNPQVPNCLFPTQQYHYYYAEAWYNFKATQSTHSIYFENQAKFSPLLEALEEHKEGLGINLHNLNPFISVYHKEDDDSYVSVVCDVPIDSLHTISDLQVDNTYYIKVYYKCINYLTDLNFGIGVSDFVDEDNDGFSYTEDCDDQNASINPDAEETPYNGIDDDCDPQTLDDDLDQDGFLDADDCDDTNPDINPDAEEIADNGIDEDCDGQDLITGVLEFPTSTVKIFPNPATKIINIEANGKLDFAGSIYDLNGRMILSEINQNKLNVQTIPTGMYLLEIKDLKTSLRMLEKIVIER